MKLSKLMWAFLREVVEQEKKGGLAGGYRMPTVNACVKRGIVYRTSQGVVKPTDVGRTLYLLQSVMK